MILEEEIAKMVNNICFSKAKGNRQQILRYCDTLLTKFGREPFRFNKNKEQKVFLLGVLMENNISKHYNH
jgi:hypothetical protein